MTVPTATFPALGTTTVVAAESAGALAEAEGVVRAALVAIDLACSRFRDDAELVALNRRAGDWVEVSPLLCAVLDAALTAARQTDGAVDPTIGAALRLLGYDRDFSSLAPDGPPVQVVLTPRPRWSHMDLDRARRRVRVPSGVELDLGATAKAFAADMAADRAAARTGGGVLVGLGGDLAVRGPAPAGGWSVRVTDDHAGPLDAPGQDIRVHSGGLATSSVCVRAWRCGHRRLHHIIDPATSYPADGPWRTVSVAAATCTDANTAATAAIVRGATAEDWLSGLGLPARLVGIDGEVRTVAGWPCP
jgi:thiamine biosynthesis lipoprotein